MLAGNIGNYRRNYRRNNGNYRRNDRSDRIAALRCVFRRSELLASQLLEILEYASVELVANPNEGFVFASWRRPDGSLAGLEPRLVVYGDMQAGCYTARFRSRSQCNPPLLISPDEVSINVKTREQFSYEILVDESCLPVEFKMKTPVKGVKVDPITGVVTGMFMRAMKNTFEISVIGSDPGRTEKTVRLTIESSQKKLTPRRRKR